MYKKTVRVRLLTTQQLYYILAIICGKGVFVTSCLYFYYKELLL
jgi:hypothetical protein